MEFLAELGLFVAKALIIVIAIAAVIGAIARAARSGESGAPKMRVKKLNETYRRLGLALKRSVLPKHALKKVRSEEKARAKARSKAKGQALTTAVERPRIYVLDFDGNVRASQVSALREEVTAILMVARPHDEVVVRLESSGGFVHAYGLAASQLERIKAREIALTVAVDKVAASGGYMMACVGAKVLAAPFAIIGSIGVVAGVPNVHRLLKKNNVDFELFTAGKYKRTVTVMGENTKEGRAKFQDDLEETHGLFKSHIQRHRPALDIEKVSTGEHWYGTQALSLGLIDEVTTSDDYLLSKLDSADLYSIQHKVKKPLLERVSGAAQGAIEGAIEQILHRSNDRHEM
ncbi:MAG: serine protease SohB [Myxococcota bacterium]|jgi:serine protease SohB